MPLVYGVVTVLTPCWPGWRQSPEVTPPLQKGGKVGQTEIRGGANWNLISHWTGRARGLRQSHLVIISGLGVDGAVISPPPRWLGRPPTPGLAGRGAVCVYPVPRGHPRGVAGISVRHQTSARSVWQPKGDRIAHTLLCSWENDLDVDQAVKQRLDIISYNLNSFTTITMPIIVVNPSTAGLFGTTFHSFEGGIAKQDNQYFNI